MPVSEPIIESEPLLHPLERVDRRGSQLYQDLNESGKEVGFAEGSWGTYGTRKVNGLWATRTRDHPKEINGQRTKMTNTFQAFSSPLKI